VTVRNRYFVTYDISDDGRRTAVYKGLRGFGDHLQYSVFRCDLSPRRRAELEAAIAPLIDPVADQVLIIDLGPVDGRGETCVSSLGRDYRNPERTAVIV
jgi:CRISPR-associated protein Cas2